VKKRRWTSAPAPPSAPWRADSAGLGCSASCCLTAARAIAKSSGGNRRRTSSPAWRTPFLHFGGVPKRLVIDNLKAAVARGDWYDPEVHPKLQSFARHYGTVFLPTKPYTPRHKGKMESGVKYAKRNALKARIFTSLTEENESPAGRLGQAARRRAHGHGDPRPIPAPRRDRLDHREELPTQKSERQRRLRRRTCSGLKTSHFARRGRRPDRRPEAIQKQADRR